jgi:hypothetical protein
MSQEILEPMPSGGLRVKENKTTKFWLSLLRLINSLLRTFSLRKTRQFWGIVYDSVSKQPLDPVIVKLLYADGREIETCVTDLAGSYGFLAQPGKFKIFVRKTHYLFPSKYVSGDSDGIFENLYHGEFFQLFNDEEVVAPNIPMDPENFDWNQQAKQKVFKSHTYSRLLLKNFFAVIFWFVLILAIIEAWHFYPRIPLPIFIVAAIYIVLLIFAKFFPEERLWGQIQAINSVVPQDKLVLELNKPQFLNIGFGKCTVRADGKFLLRATKGDYVLTVSQLLESGEKQFLASLPVSVNGQNILNGSFIISG